MNRIVVVFPNVNNVLKSTSTSLFSCVLYCDLNVTFIVTFINISSSTLLNKHQ